MANGENGYVRRATFSLVVGIAIIAIGAVFTIALRNAIFCAENKTRAVGVEGRLTRIENKIDRILDRQGQ